MNNAERPAMPYAKGEHDCDMNSRDTRGITKRELLAAMAMQGMIGNPQNDTNPVTIAAYAVRYADELLKQLES